jgi:hypothetical protein
VFVREKVSWGVLAYLFKHTHSHSHLPSDVVDDLAARAESLAGLGVEHQVQVTLAEASLLLHGDGLTLCSVCIVCV